MSVYVSVLVCVAMLVAMSITAVWVPSAVLADDELVQASKGQLASSVEQVSKELLGYFQVASSHAEVVGLKTLPTGHPWFVGVIPSRQV
jgi:hypothetical protein